MAAYRGGLPEPGRMDVLLALSYMDGPKARQFLLSELAILAEEQSYVKQGLKRLDAVDKVR